jgi:hypothetical protein
MKPTRTDKIAGQSRFWTDYGKYALVYCAHIGLGIAAAMLVSYGLLQAGLLPKEIKVEAVSDLTDDQLEARISSLSAALNFGMGNLKPRGNA